MKRIADELEHVGEWGRVVLFVANGDVTRIEGVRSQLFVDERAQARLVCTICGEKLSFESGAIHECSMRRRAA